MKHKRKYKLNEYELEQTVKNGSKNIDDYLFLGHIYLDRGDYNKLLDLYGKALSLALSEGERALLIHEKGQALNSLGEKEKAVRCFEKSLELLDNEKDSYNYLDLTGLNHYNLFLAYGIEEGRKYAELALAEFELFLKRNPDHEETYKFLCCLADLYLWLEKYDKALECHRKAFEISENIDWKVSCLSGMGRVCISKGDFANAETYLKQALVIADNNVSLLSSLYYNVGETYYHSKRIDESLNAFQKALQYRNDDPGLRYDNEYLADILRHLGDLAYDSEDYDKAIDHFVMVLENIGKENIHYCNCHITLGHCYLIKEEYANARQHYNMVLSSPNATEEEIKVVKESLSRCPLDS